VLRGKFEALVLKHKPYERLGLSNGDRGLLAERASGHRKKNNRGATNRLHPQICAFGAYFARGRKFAAGTGSAADSLLQTGRELERQRKLRGRRASNYSVRSMLLLTPLRGAP
jgi:hypothetical protein